MTLCDVLIHLRTNKVAVKVNDSELLIRAPQGVLDSEVI